MLNIVKRTCICFNQYRDLYVSNKNLFNDIMVFHNHGTYSMLNWLRRDISIV